jgi:hypothetical protein
MPPRGFLSGRSSPRAISRTSDHHQEGWRAHSRSYLFRTPHHRGLISPLVGFTNVAGDYLGRFVARVPLDDRLALRPGFIFIEETLPDQGAARLLGLDSTFVPPGATSKGPSYLGQHAHADLP